MDSKELINEHKHIKQGFVLATLISTVAGTFITSLNLYDRLIEQRKQKKRDKGQNKRIKELEERLNEAEAEKKRLREGSSGGKDSHDGPDNFRNSLQQSSNAVQQEYERYFANLGSKFAQGDLVAQTQLQSQIILLQGSVIKLLEEALLTGTIPDINRLYNTSEFAREGSLRALRDQYQRLLESSAPVPQQRLRPGRPTGPVRRISSTPSLRDYYSSTAADSAIWTGQRQLGPAAPRKTLASYDRPPPPSDPLFCRLAQDVQRTDRPLDSCLTTTDRSPSSMCTTCGAAIGLDVWRVEKEVAVRGRESDDESEVIVVRTYLLTRRFLFKCHREGSEYACYLCFRNRDRDTVCRSEEGLVSHVTSKHSTAEYEADRDIRDLSRALPYR
ncbi:hypothetical protein N657DRAFT_134009 [Parathielavia appendiculata]|uniref:Uncharacterized protein n=1 Tax=Parathielavia appendiculata TaxID=2587402 RepID=A0AAN6TV30_9PEZI|nr:hypothetical protein N657DRAFT_134009 [Parathielavia appendiculata]